MKGIILAGGMNTRLFPTSYAVPKHLLLLYDKPVIYYPICSLIELGIKDIVILCNKKDLPLYKRLLSTGEKWGLKFYYIAQPQEYFGTASALFACEQFFTEDVTIILGDNLFDFLSNNIKKFLLESSNNLANIISYKLKDNNMLGVLYENKDKNIIIENPTKNLSNKVVPGIYIYKKEILNYKKSIYKSNCREITLLNNYLLEKQQVNIIHFNDKSLRWFDVGTPNRFINASNYVFKQLKKHKRLIGYIEYTALKNNLIDINAVTQLLTKLNKTEYAQNLKLVLVKEGFNV